MVKNDTGVHGSDVQYGSTLEDQHVNPVLPCHIPHVFVDVKVAGLVEYDLA